MNDTLARDKVARLAKSNPKKALEGARKISDPWFRAQALAWVLRFTDADVDLITSLIEKSANACDDPYKRCAVRAWDIAALSECNILPKAKKILNTAMRQAQNITPLSSRSEALFLLFQAAIRIDKAEAILVHEALNASCVVDGHWRCKRAIRDAAKILSGALKPRQFFW
ncbi:MAG: hypothetical protein AAF827_22845 [Cyanobacteria bacterium P01_D01_bin.6]